MDIKLYDEGDSMQKVAFVLSGGGAAGSFEAGAMKALSDRGIVPSIIYGTSVGALNAVGYSRLGPDKLISDLWYSIKGRKDIMRFNWWNLLWARGLFNTKPLQKLLQSVLAGDQSFCEAVVCYVDMAKDEVKYVSNINTDPNIFYQSTLASASIPVVMEPVNKTWVDGGTRDNTPLKPAIDAGYETIYVILCSPFKASIGSWDGPKWPYIFSSAIRLADVMSHQFFVYDVNKCLTYNSIPGKKTIDLKIIAPQHPVISTLEFNPAKIRETITYGYKIASDI